MKQNSIKKTFLQDQNYQDSSENPQQLKNPNQHRALLSVNRQPVKLKKLQSGLTQLIDIDLVDAVLYVNLF